MILIGRTLLSRYNIIQKIGRGGFGETYLALDFALPGHPCCVVKHLSPNNQNPSVFSEAQRLFEREAQYLHYLGENSHQIPRLYAHFSEDGEFYLVQEFIEGYDLSQEIITGLPLNEEKTIKILVEILEVLTLVHRENVIHRDLKPTNIMRRRKDGKLVLIDFGAVKEIQGLTVKAPGKTILTLGIGSPGYMPSEQAKGRPKLASDIYAVGIIGIQALTGIRPSKLPEDPKSGEIIWRNQANVSDKFARILSKMVRDHFSRRYQDASEALRALTPLLHNSSTSSAIPTISITQAPPTWIPSDLPTYPVSQPNKPRKKWAWKVILFGLLVAVIPIIIIQLNSISTLLSQPAHLKEDYTKLETLLAKQQWQAADKQTERLMLKVANREDEAWIDADAIANFSCTDLRQINQLWSNYSDNNFGFNVQKQIYLETGNTLGKFKESAYQQFGEEIGWRKNGRWLNYSELNFDKNAPRGQFPACTNADQNFSGCRWPLYGLFARAESCKL